MKVIKKISSRSPKARATAAAASATTTNGRYTEDISNYDPEAPGTLLRDTRDAIRATMSCDSNYDDPNIPDLQSIGSLDALGGRSSSLFNLASSTTTANGRYTEDISNDDPETPGTLATISSRESREAIRASMSCDSNFDDPNIADLKSVGSLDALGGRSSSVFNLGLSADALEEGKGNNPPKDPAKTLCNMAIKATLESEKYDADRIRKEFRRYQKELPSPDELLQKRHSFSLLRKLIEDKGIEPPRFLQYKFEGGIKPHHALCCLLLSEYQHAEEARKAGWNLNCPSWVNVLSCNKLHSQINDPAEFIRDQFFRVVDVIPLDVVPADVLRKKIRNRGLPVPNYFLDPEDDNAIPAHIALLVILQENELESWKFGHIVYHWAFSTLSFVALLLRVVLEVIGGAGAIWGGAEVFTLRTAENATLWRWISVAVGIMCFLRFITLNAPQLEDEGDILGPAGPWSLRFAVRMRAVTNHPFHYFMRARPPSSPNKTM